MDGGARRAIVRRVVGKRSFSLHRSLKQVVLHLGNGFKSRMMKSSWLWPQTCQGPFLALALASSVLLYQLQRRLSFFSVKYVSMK